MSRRARENQVPRAPLSLQDSGPRSSTDLYAALGYKWFVAAPGSAADARATVDAKVCPYCDAIVEWALTVKRDPAAKGGIQRYVYARCTQHPEQHRWGFRDTADTRAITPAPKPSAPAVQPVNPTPAAPEPTAMPEITPAAAPAGSLDAVIGGIIDARIGSRLSTVEETALALARKASLDPQQISALIQAEIAKLPDTRKVEITIPSMPSVKFTGKAHAALARVLKLIAAGERFFLLVGPAASGKSTLAKQVAEALKTTLTAVSINETMSREEILGWRAPNLSTGAVHYSPSAVVEGWERGDVILLDELDRGNPNTLCALNSIEQRVLYVPRADAEGGSVSKMGDSAIVIGAANTYGTGASRTYVGANQLDAAFLDRWYTIEVGYDHDLECEITGSPVAVELIEAARKRADARSVRRPMTTRMARRAARDATMAGETDAVGVRKAFKALCKEAGWTTTELDGVWC